MEYFSWIHLEKSDERVNGRVCRLMCLNHGAGEQYYIALLLEPARNVPMVCYLLMDQSHPPHFSVWSTVIMLAEVALLHE